MQPSRRPPEPPPPWLNSIFRLGALLPGTGGKAVKVVGFLGTLAALGFSVIYILNNVFPDWRDTTPRLPAVTSVSPSEVSPGQEADIIGKNLGKITEAHLTKGGIDERIFLLPISATRLTVSVPQGVEPEKYNLELIISGKKTAFQRAHWWSSRYLLLPLSLTLHLLLLHRPHRQ